MNAICKTAKVDKVIGDHKSCASNPVTGSPGYRCPNESGRVEDGGRDESLVDFRAQFGIGQRLARRPAGSAYWVGGFSEPFLKHNRLTSTSGQIGKYIKQTGTRYGFSSN